ncbi:MAG TPA: adenylyl-sulfate kinase [Gaiellaceae bacterium]|jgi:adenylyl-sulfate kinase|nr:adenylyl-sulfate kinase [Gaiellaceae bacterium]
MGEAEGAAPAARRGFTVWLTGLSGAGKTTVGSLVAEALEGQGRLVERLDGDVVRRHLSQELGFSARDRDLNVHRIGWVAARLTRAGAAVVASVISPHGAARAEVRRLVEEWGPFVEVHVDAPVEECARRDAKGLYARAFRGEIPDFTGVSAPYEPPEAPEVRLRTTEETPEESARRVLEALAARGLVPGAGTTIAP